MSEVGSTARYIRGKDKILDRRYAEYKKIRPFSGNAWSKALTDKELGIMAELWRKERRSCYMLQINELRTLLVGDFVFLRKNIILFGYIFVK